MSASKVSLMPRAMIWVMPVCVISDAIATRASIDMVDFNADRRTLPQMSRHTVGPSKEPAARYSRIGEQAGVKQNGARVSEYADRPAGFRWYGPAKLWSPPPETQAV